MIPVWNPTWIGYVDHANRRESITKQDVSSTARVLKGKRKKKRKKCDALSALSPCLCASNLFLHRVACQPMDFCSCQVSLYCHKSMCSVLVIVPFVIPCSFEPAPIRPSSFKSCLSVCVRSILENLLSYEK